jgi:hypothetical protein
MVVGGLAFGGAGSGFIVQYISALLAVVSIMAAAILVRLNRGVPSVDWKSVEPDYLRNLLDGIERITRAYVITFVIALICVGTIFGVGIITSSQFIYKIQAAFAATSVFGVLFGLLSSRMVYIIWLDLDIVRLQRAVIMSAAENIEGEQQKKIADKKIDDMARVRITPL